MELFENGVCVCFLRTGSGSVQIGARTQAVKNQEVTEPVLHGFSTNEALGKTHQAKLLD